MIMIMSPPMQFIAICPSFSGGYNGSKDLSSGEYYDPLSNSWQMMSCNMNSRRSCLGITTLNGLIYVRFVPLKWNNREVQIDLSLP